MSRRLAHALPTILAAVLSSALPSVLHAAGIDGVLLLTNGNLLEGEIIRSGDRYQVAAAGVLLQVPERQVDSFFPSKSAAYRELRRRVGRFDAGVHVALAQWCLRHEMANEAAKELQAAQRLSADHPRLPALQRQLAAIRANLEAAARPVETRQPPASTPPNIQPEVSREPEPRAELSAAPPTIGYRDEPGDRPWTPSPQVQLSDELRGQFVRSIQPMLVHSCTAIGCHQADSQQGFQLDRLAVTAGSHPAVFERNLGAILNQFGDGEPSESALVGMARRQHGVEPQVSTPLRPRQLELLAAWVAEATGVDADSESPAEKSTTDSQPETDGDPSAIAVPDPTASTGSPPGLPVASSNSGGGDLPTFEELDSLDWGTSEVQRGAPPRQDAYAPRDPFDPEVFNRLYEPPR